MLFMTLYLYRQTDIVQKYLSRGKIRIPHLVCSQYSIKKLTPIWSERSFRYYFGVFDGSSGGVAFLINMDKTKATATIIVATTNASLIPLMADSFAA